MTVWHVLWMECQLSGQQPFCKTEKAVKKFTVKTHSTEGCERTDSENITQLLVELRKC